ncbi:DUF418 domain-containing protein [Pseudogracilibacillus sp. SO30301A]|uniref:DUF418 domain-containing protein n=1 Tax=Pseudogracilibacillus sp. SO30301A TaxID=3098291 RepID=UPI00300DFD2D
MNEHTRIHAIDGIRGFSLFGILLANLLIFQYGLWGKDEIHLFELSRVDQYTYAFTKIFIEGSFMPIFTFLFGYSMIMMKNSLERKKLRVKWHLFRRMVMLIIIGLLHSIYFWEGDILLLYGAMGILLLMFVNRKPKTILIWGVSLFLLFGIGSFFGEEELQQADTDFIDAYIEKTTEIYSSGTYAEIKDYRNNNEEDPLSKELGEGKMVFLVLLTPLVIAPMFLFGMYAAKRKMFFRPYKEKQFYWIGFTLFLPVGLLFNIIGYFYSESNWGMGLAMIGEMLLAFGYIFLIALLYCRKSKFRILTYLENIGKLSLTNYIMQTVICTTIFYGYGFALFGRAGVTDGILLGIVIFALQIYFSTIYLNHFRYGPLEKITRSFTYLSFLKFNKKRTKGKVA